MTARLRARTLPPPSRSTSALLGAALLLLTMAAAAAQEPEFRARLTAAGAPAEFVGRVAAVVDSARAEGLPADPLQAKAMEGWAKRNRVSTQQVVAVMEQLRVRLRESNEVCVRNGYENPPGPLVAAGAEALARGLTREQVRELIQATPTPDAAAAGITVAAALAAQGLDAAAAVQAVRAQQQRGGPPEAIFELPSAVANMLAHGTPMQDVARQIMQGGGLQMPGGMGGAGPGSNRPDAVPPAKGPGSTDPPGRGGRRPGGGNS